MFPDRLNSQASRSKKTLATLLGAFHFLINVGFIEVLFIICEVHSNTLRLGFEHEVAASSTLIGAFHLTIQLPQNPQSIKVSKMHISKIKNCGTYVILGNAQTLKMATSRKCQHVENAQFFMRLCNFNRVNFTTYRRGSNLQFFQRRETPTSFLV